MIVETLNTKSKVRTRNGFSNADNSNISFDLGNKTEKQLIDLLSDYTALVTSKEGGLSKAKNDYKKNYDEYIDSKNKYQACASARGSVNGGARKNSKCKLTDLNKYLNDWDYYSNEKPKFSALVKNAADDLKETKLVKKKIEKFLAEKDVINKETKKDTTTANVYHEEVFVEEVEEKVEIKKRKYKPYLIGGGAIVVIGITSLIIFRK